MKREDKQGYIYLLKQTHNYMHALNLATVTLHSGAQQVNWLDFLR